MSCVERRADFIPVRLDFADLADLMAYFFGDLDGEYAHQRAAMAMAARSSRWAEDHLRLADVQSYLFRLVLELARLEADDRVAASY